MKKILFALCAAIAAAIALIALAFFYIDFSVRTSASYDVFLKGKQSRTAKVDRYVTEDKVIYKSREECPDALSYRFTSSRLFLKKGSLAPLKYIEEASLGRGTARLILLVQDYDKTDYLYMEYPKFLVMRGFETGEKTNVFSPYDIMTYMPIMEKYNFWKGGTQYFEVLVPVNDAIPPMRDKIEVRDLGGEYISVMGRKVEAETFAVKARAIPETKITLARYTHRILALEIGNTGERYIMTSFAENPAKRIRSLFARAGSVMREKWVMSEISESTGPEPSETGYSAGAEIADGKSAQPGHERQRDIFFESGGIILSGKMWVPSGEGPFPAVLFIPKDGPMTGAEQMLIRAYGEKLSDAGYVMMSYDAPGEGKSRGALLDMDDTKQLKNINAAISHLLSSPLVKKDPLALLGHKGGAYLALEAAKEAPATGYCVLLALPLKTEKAEASPKTIREEIQSALSVEGLGAFDANYVDTVTQKMAQHLEEVARSSENISYFLGTKVPTGAYREYLTRKPLKSVLGVSKPTLIVFGKNDPDAGPAIDAARKIAVEKGNLLKVAVFNNINAYMGDIIEEPEGRRFAADNDVLKTVIEWLNQQRGLSAVQADVPEAPEQRD